MLSDSIVIIFYRVLDVRILMINKNTYSKLKKFNLAKIIQLFIFSHNFNLTNIKCVIINQI